MSALPTASVSRSLPKLAGSEVYGEDLRHLVAEPGPLLAKTTVTGAWKARCRRLMMSARWRALLGRDMRELLRLVLHLQAEHVEVLGQRHVDLGRVQRQRGHA